MVVSNEIHVKNIFAYILNKLPCFRFQEQPFSVKLYSKSCLHSKTFSFNVRTQIQNEPDNNTSPTGKSECLRSFERPQTSEADWRTGNNIPVIFEGLEPNLVTNGTLWDVGTCRSSYIKDNVFGVQNELFDIWICWFGGI